MGFILIVDMASVEIPETSRTINFVFPRTPGV